MNDRSIYFVCSFFLTVPRYQRYHKMIQIVKIYNIYFLAICFFMELRQKSMTIFLGPGEYSSLETHMTFSIIFLVYIFLFLSVW